MTPSKVRARGNGIGTPDRGPELVEKQLLLSSPSIAATPLMHGSSGGRGGRWKWVLLVFLAAGSLVLWARSQGSASLGWEQSFVKVAGTQFEYQCRPFFIAGLNVDNIAQAPLAAVSRKMQGSGSSGYNGRELVRQLLREAAGAGLNVMRTWAHTTDPDHPLQDRPGVYNEDMFQGLDFVIAEAGKAGLKVILSLVDNWKYHGGVDEFVDWSPSVPPRDPRFPPNNKQGDASVEEYSKERLEYENRRKVLFFTDEACRNMFKRHIKAVLLRRNVYTGMLYKDDPTIMAHNLLNEHRCSAYETPACPQIVSRWVEEMAGHVKSLDQRHLLTLGEEGFWGEKDALRAYNPGAPSSDWAAKAGQDFLADHASPFIDFATVHWWNDQWKVGSNRSFYKGWLEQHAEQAGSVLKKPLLLEEFGKMLDTRVGIQPSAGLVKHERDPVFQDAYGVVQHAVSRGQALAGSLFWRWGFQVYDNGLGPYGVAPEHSTFSLIAEHARRLKQHMNSQPPRPNCNLQCWVPTTIVFGLVRRCQNMPDVCSKLQAWQASHKAHAGEGGLLQPNGVEVFASQDDCCRPGLGGFSEGCSVSWL